MSCNAPFITGKTDHAMTALQPAYISRTVLDMQCPQPTCQVKAAGADWWWWISFDSFRAVLFRGQPIPQQGPDFSSRDYVAITQGSCGDTICTRWFGRVQQAHQVCCSCSSTRKALAAWQSSSWGRQSCTTASKSRAETASSRPQITCSKGDCELSDKATAILVRHPCTKLAGVGRKTTYPVQVLHAVFDVSLRHAVCSLCAQAQPAGASTMTAAAAKQVGPCFRWASKLHGDVPVH